MSSKVLWPVLTRDDKEAQILGDGAIMKTMSVNASGSEFNPRT